MQSLNEQQITLLKYLAEQTHETLKPLPNIGMAEWCEQYLYLSANDSARPGRFTFDPAEYQREIFNTISDSNVRKVVIKAASQTVKTQSLLSMLAYVIANDPGPVLITEPNENLCKTISKRIDHMVDATPALQGKIRDKRERDSGNTLYSKAFPGGNVYLRSVASPASMAMLAIRYLFIDEASRGVINSEGNAISQARARLTTYGYLAKEVIVSSPADEETCVIESEFLYSDQRHFHVPCNKCGAEQTLIWECVKWDDKIKKVHYECQHCGELWTNAQKNRNVKKGRWIAQAPENETPGFTINAIYSSFITIQDLAKEFIAAKRSGVEELKPFINTRLGEVFRDHVNELSDIPWFTRLEAYTPQTLPEDVLILTLGCDIGDNNLCTQVRGFGIDDHAWTIEYKVFHGDPTQNNVWNEFANYYFDKLYTRTDGLKMKILAYAIDSGYATQNVVDFCNKYRKRQVYAIKGVAGVRPIFPDRSKRGKYGTFYPIGVDTAKTKLSRLLQVDGPEKSGFQHFPLSIDDIEFFNELTGETRKIIRKKDGSITRQWRKKKDQDRVEVWDTAIYALAARYSIKMNLHKYAETLKLRAQQHSQIINKDNDKNIQQNQSTPPARRKGFISGLQY